MSIKKLTFVDGAYSPKEFAERFCTPLFERGVITPHPKADYYAICFGELCAYSNTLINKQGDGLLATWSVEFPDSDDDGFSNDGSDDDSFRGEWQPF